MQISLFRQFFLTQFDVFSVSANGLANYFLMSQGLGHAFLGKQEVGRKNTVNSPLFFACIPFRSRLGLGNSLKESEFVKMAESIFAIAVGGQTGVGRHKVMYECGREITKLKRNFC
jgi:hypothetical protein